MCCLLTWISDQQKEKKESKTMCVYSYTILMPPIFYHLKTRYFVKNHPMHSQIRLHILQLFQIGIIVKCFSRRVLCRDSVIVMICLLDTLNKPNKHLNLTRRPFFAL